MKSADVFPSKYLKAADLRGHEPTVTISSVVMEELNDGKKPIAYFSGKEKGLVLNRTNWGMLEFLYGDESDTWVGQRIQLYAAMTTDRAGKPVLGLRVKAPPKHSESEQTQQPRRIAATAPNGGLGQQGLNQLGQQGHQFVTQDRGTHKISTTQAIQQQQNDDPLADDGEIPF